MRSQSIAFQTPITLQAVAGGRGLRRGLLAVLTTSIASLAPACSCGGDVIVLDGFDADSDVADVLHPWASGGKVGLTVRGIDGFEMKTLGDPVIEGAGSLDPDVDIEGGGTLTFGVLTEEPGTLTIRLVDKDGNQVSEVREVEVVEVDRIELAVTAPTTPDIDLPAVDPTNILIFDGQQAAFRTSLFADNTEVFAHEAITVAGEIGSGRDCIACADDSCEADRPGLEFQAPFGADPVTGTLTAGSASLAITITAVPPEAITDVVLDQGGEFDGKRSVVAQVLQGTDPVFGAPVQWSVDGTVLADEDNDVPFEGDVVQYKAASQLRQVAAILGDRTQTIPVSGSDFEVTSISFACGAGPGAAAPAALLALLGARGLRRRRKATPSAH